MFCFRAQFIQSTVNLVKGIGSEMLVADASGRGRRWSRWKWQNVICATLLSAPAFVQAGPGLCLASSSFKLQAVEPRSIGFTWS